VRNRVDIYAKSSEFINEKLLVAGNGMEIFDLSTPTEPVQISHYEVWNGTFLDVYDDRAYFASYSCGMYNCDNSLDVVDLSDPYNPVGLGFIDTNEWPAGVQFKDNFVFVTDGSQTKIFELLGDGTYALRSTLEFSGWMHYENNSLYISSSASIEVYDVEDPAEPDSRGGFTYSIPCGRFQTALPLIYCSYFIHTYDRVASGFEVIDTSHPDEMEWIGAYETSLDEPFLVNQVYLDGDRLYLSSLTSVVTYYGPTVEFLIYDLADPLAPQFGNRYSPGRGYGLWYEALNQSAQITDRIGYFISIFQDLEITDLSDPSNPRILSTYESNSKLVRTEPPYLYTISSDGGAETMQHRLVTLDATDLMTPTVESKFLISDSIWVDIIGGFDVSGGIAYIGLPKEVQVVDVRDPKHPSLLSKLTWDTWNPPSVIEAEGSLVLIARQGILEILDASDPTSPQIVGTVTTGGHPSAVQIIGNLAYVACRETGVQVIDLADPANPRVVKQYYGNTASVQTRPGLPVYLANQQDGLQIYKPYPLSTRR
jgi:hypothetical protein